MGGCHFLALPCLVIRHSSLSHWRSCNFVIILSDYLSLTQSFIFAPNIIPRQSLCLVSPFSFSSSLFTFMSSICDQFSRFSNYGCVFFPIAFLHFVCDCFCSLCFCIFFLTVFDKSLDCFFHSSCPVLLLTLSSCQIVNSKMDNNFSFFFLLFHSSHHFIFSS